MATGLEKRFHGYGSFWPELVELAVSKTQVFWTLNESNRFYDLHLVLYFSTDIKLCEVYDGLCIKSFTKY